MTKVLPNEIKDIEEPFDCIFKSTLPLREIVVLTGDSGVGKSNILLRYIYLA